MIAHGILVLILLCVIISDCWSKNVLFLLADDGGFEIGAYGNKIVQTPNIDALAKKSLIFNKAFTPVSSCSPSRASILTGLPSHQNGMYGLHQGVHNFNAMPNVISLPQILSTHGINTGIIGKKHVGPSNVFPFGYSETEENHSILQVGRNITKMKLLAREFLNQNKNSSFFLYIGFHDPHRCGHSHPEYGNFCEQFGNGEPNMGVIPDWTPIIYEPEQVEVPYYVPDTFMARGDIAAQYTTISRLDSGNCSCFGESPESRVGLMLKELSDAGLDDDTLVIYTSDNGIPFPAGRTNLYDSGSAVPLMISSPLPETRKNEVTYSLTSLLDITPTILDWFGIKTCQKKNCNKSLELGGKSLLPLVNKEPYPIRKAVYSSHNLHEVTMYYPMRAIRTKKYKLINNLNNPIAYPIDQDFYISPTFQDLLNNTRFKKPTYWYRTLQEYYFRQEWELYDLHSDPEETNNIIHDSTYNGILANLQKMLHTWQLKTKDPWICGTRYVLENDTCLPLYNF